MTGTVNESNENGSEITFSVSGDTFVQANITTANITATGLPAGVTIGSVSYTNTTQFKVTLSGNRTTDYDSDITNATFTVKGAAYTGRIGDAIIDTGVTFEANTSLDGQELIQNIADNNTSSATNPSVDQYSSAGITDVNSTNLSAINDALNSSVNSNDLNTTAKLQNLVDSYNVIIALADGVDNNGTKPTNAHYEAIGVTDTNNTALLSMLGDVLDTKYLDDIDTIAEIQALVTSTQATLDATNASHFVVEVTVTDANKTVAFYTSDTSYDIHWGDADFAIAFDNTSVSGNQTHTYAAAGTYTIRTRNLTDIRLGAKDDDFDTDPDTDEKANAEKFTKLVQWGTGVWDATGLEEGFYNAVNLVGDFSDKPNLTSATSLKKLFQDAKKFNSDVSGWDVSKVTNFERTFGSASVFNQSLTNWDVSKATTTENMFRWAQAFNQPLDNAWESMTDNNNTNGMFWGSAMNNPIGDWDVSSVVDMSQMLTSNYKQNDLNDWNISSVRNLSKFANGNGIGDLNLSKWDTSNVTNMDELVGYNTNIIGLENWNFGGITSSYIILKNANTQALINVDSWPKTVPGASLEGAFIYAKAYGYGDWNVSSITDMSNLFKNSNANDDISSWNFEQVANFENMLNTSNMSIDNVEKLMKRLAEQDVLDNVTMNLSGTNYTTDMNASMQSLISDDSWTFAFDAGKDFKWKPFTMTATNQALSYVERSGSNLAFASDINLTTVETSDKASQFNISITNVKDGANENIIIDGTTITLSAGTSGTTATSSYDYNVTSDSNDTVKVRFGNPEHLTVAEWKALSVIQPIIRAATYNYLGDDPTLTRTFNVRVVDEQGKSVDTNTSVVTITKKNNAPTLSATATTNKVDNNGSGVTIFTSSDANTTENTQKFKKLILNVTNVTTTDSETMIIDGIDVSIGASATAQNAGSVDYNISVSGTTRTITLYDFNKTNTEMNTLIDSLKYKRVLTGVTTPNRVFTITDIQDNGGTTNGGADTNSSLSVSSTLSIVDAFADAYAKVNALADGIDNNATDLNQTEFNAIGISEVNTTEEASLLSSVIDNKNAGDVNTTAKISALAVIVDKIMNAALGITPIPTVADLAALGITPTITADNLDAYMEQVKDAGVSGANTITKLNALAQTQKTVIDTTVSGADANNSNLSDANLTDAGITDVNTSNIATINSFLNTSDINGTDVNTSTKVQTLVDAVNNLENNTTLDEGNLTVLGLDNDMNVSDGNVTSLFNSVVPDGNNSAVHVKEVAKSVNLVQNTASGTLPTTAAEKQALVDALAKLGVTPTVTLENVAAYAQQLKTAGASGANTITKLNALAQTQKTVIDTTVSGADANNSNLSDSNLTDAGITDVNSTNIVTINSFLNTSDINGTDVNTSTKVQTLVDAINNLENNTTLDEGNLTVLGLDNDMNVSNTNQRELLNSIIPDGNNSATHIKEVASAVKALQDVANSTTTIPLSGQARTDMLANLTKLGVTPTITADNLDAYLNAIKSATVSGADSLTELNSIADAVVNGVANLAQNAVDNNATTDASALSDMGITGADASNMDELNSFLNSADIAGTDVNTTTKLQALNDAVNAIIDSASEVNATQLETLGLDDDMNTSDSRSIIIVQ
jgi:surface protein